MRLLAFFSLLLLIAALILNVLLFLAGNRVDFLEQIDIITLNTSDVGRTLVSSSSSPVQSAISSAVNGNPVASAVAAANPSASAAVIALAASEANSVAEAVGLHDFYSFHVQNWCEGYYTPSPTAANATRNVTGCSNTTALWDFNLTQILQSELKVGFLVSDLNIPSAVNDGFVVLQTAFKVMYIFYCITIGTIGVGILGGLAALLLDGRISACLNGIWAFLTAACAIVASGIATAIMIAGQNVINEYQDDIGVTSTRGTQFLAMTWAGAALLVVAFLTWAVDCCCGSGYRSTHKRRFGRYQPANKEMY